MSPEDEALAALYDEYAAWEELYEPGLAEALFALQAECMTED